MSKKSGKILITFVILAMLAFTIVACGPVDEKTIFKSIEVLEKNDEVEVRDFSITDISFKVVDNKDNSFTVKATKSMLSEDDQSKLTTDGIHTLTFKYYNLSITVTVTLYPDSVDPNLPEVDEKVTISFEANGGSVVESIKGDKTKVIIESEPVTEKDGSNFGGWYADSKFGSAKIKFPYESKHSMVLYAKWLDNQVVINFEGNAEDATNIPSSQTIISGSTMQTVATPTRLGYSFDGWYTSLNYSGGKITSSTSFSSNTILYAKWKANSYILTYNFLGGSTSDISAGNYSKNYDFNTIINEYPFPEKAGFDFVGWFTEESYSNWDSSAYQFSKMPARNFNLIAKWEVANENYFYSYETNPDNTVVITGARSEYSKANTATHLHIPNLIDNKPVVAIGKEAFKGFKNLIAINIADGVKSIGEGAFKDSSKLNSALSSIPTSVVSIGNNAFGFNWQYDTIVNNFALQDIGNGKFVLLKYLGIDSVVTIPDGVVKIASNAFVLNDKNNSLIGHSLQEVIIPSSVEVIEKNAFRNCKNLIAVTFSEDTNIKQIHSSAFMGSLFLESKELQKDKVIFGNLYYKYFGVETTVIIPENIKYLGDYLFSESSSVEKFVFEDESNIKIIGKGVFTDAQYIELSKKSNFCIINEILVRYIGKEVSITIPDSVKTISGYAFGDETSPSTIDSIIVNENVENILAYAFYGMQNIRFTFMGAIPPIIDVSAFYKATTHGNTLLNNMTVYIAYNLADYYDNLDWAVLSEKLIQLRVVDVAFDSDKAINTAYSLGDSFSYNANSITVITNDGNSYNGDDVKVVFDLGGFNSSVAEQKFILVDDSKYFIKVGGNMVAYDSSNALHLSLPRYYKAFADYTLYSNCYFEINSTNYIINDFNELVEYSDTEKHKYDGNIIYVSENDGLFVYDGNGYINYDRTDENHNILAKYANTYVKNMCLLVSSPKGTTPVSIIVAYSVTPKIDDIEIIDFSNKYFKGDEINFENAKLKITYDFGTGEPVVKVIPLIKYIVEANATNVQLLSNDRYVLIEDEYILFNESNDTHLGLDKYVRVMDEKFVYSNLSTSVSNITNIATFKYDYSNNFSFEYSVDEPEVESIRVDEKILLSNGTYVENKLINVYSVTEKLNRNEGYITLVYNNGSVSYKKLNSDDVTVENFNTEEPATNLIMTIKYASFVIEYVYEVQLLTEHTVFDYQILENNKAVIIGINTINTKIYIPDTFEEDGITYTIIGIAESAFDGVIGLDYIDIPSTVEVIGKGAFKNSEIKIVNFRTGSALKAIPDNAFANTQKLESVRFNDARILSIGKYAFYNSGIKVLEIPACVEVINEWAFSESSLNRIGILPISRLQQIKASAFENCKSLSSIYLPELLCSLGNRAFAGTSITEVVIPSMIKDIPVELFEDATSLTSVVLPSSATTIHQGAFKGCINLFKVTFIGFVESESGYYVYDVNNDEYIAYDLVLHDVFLRYSDYFSLDYNGDWILVDGEYVVYNPELHGESTYATRYSYDYFENIYNNGDYVLIADEYILISTLLRYKYEYLVDEEGDFVLIDENFVSYDAEDPEHLEKQRYSYELIEDIDGTFIFDGEKYINDYTTFDGVYYEDAFGIWVLIDDEYVLYEPELHDTILDRYNRLMQIDANGNFVFVGGTYQPYEPALHNGKIRYDEANSMLSKIKDRAFLNCENLIEFETTDNMVEVGDEAFKNNHNLSAFNFATGLKYIGKSAFENSGISTITIPSTVIGVGEYAFVNCKKAEKVVILSEHITEISDNMFQGCESLEFAYVLNVINRIGKQSFKDCFNFVGFSSNQNNLNESELPTALTIIDESAFENCYSLSYINLKIDNNTGVEQIKARAFKNSGIDYVALPSTLTVLGDYAFDNCENLKGVVFDYAINLQVIGKYAFRKSSIGLVQFFENDPVEGVLRLPANIKTIGEGAFSECSTIKYIIIPDNNDLTSIGDKAFKDCYALIEISLGFSKKGLVNGILSYLSPLVIGESSFENCSAMTHLFVPNSVNEIKKYAFNGCSSLEYVSFGVAINRTIWVENPDSASAQNHPYVTVVKNVNADTDKLEPIISSIGESAFAGTTSLTKIYTAFSATLLELPIEGIGLNKRQQVFLNNAGQSHFDNADFKLIIVDNQANSDRHMTRWAANASNIERSVIDYKDTEYYYTQP